MISSKGKAVTTEYTTLRVAMQNGAPLEVQNNTTGILYLTIGGSELDVDAIRVPAGGMYTTTNSVGSVIKGRSQVAGNVTLIGDELP